MACQRPQVVARGAAPGRSRVVGPDDLDPVSGGVGAKESVTEQVPRGCIELQSCRLPRIVKADGKVAMRKAMEQDAVVFEVTVADASLVTQPVAFDRACSAYAEMPGFWRKESAEPCALRNYVA